MYSALACGKLTANLHKASSSSSSSSDIMQFTEIETLAVTLTDPLPLFPCTPPPVRISVNPRLLQALLFSSMLVQQPTVQEETLWLGPKTSQLAKAVNVSI